MVYRLAKNMHGLATPGQMWQAWGGVQQGNAQTDPSSPNLTSARWASRLADFHDVTRPVVQGMRMPGVLRGSVVQAMSPENTDNADPNLRTEWVFADPIKGKALLLDKMLDDEIATVFLDDSDEALEDYVHVLAHGITAEQFQEYTQAKESIERIIAPALNCVGNFENKLNNAYLNIPYKLRRRVYDELQETPSLSGMDSVVAEIVREIDADGDVSAAIEALSNDMVEGFETDDGSLESLAEYAHARLTVEFAESERQLALERRLERAMDLIKAISDDCAAVVGAFRNGEVPYHVIPDTDGFECSHCVFTMEAMLDPTERYGSAIYIREGAPIDELFHEMVHAVSPSALPVELTCTKRLHSKIDPTDDWVSFQSAIERMDNSSEAEAFAGMAMLREAFYSKGVGRFPSSSYKKLEELIELGDVDEIYERLTSDVVAYRQQGMTNSWKVAALIKGGHIDPTRNPTHVWARDAEGWGVFSERPWEGSGSYRVTSVNLDQLLNKALSMDPTRILQMVVAAGEGIQAMKGIAAPDPEVFEQQIIGARELPLSTGDPERIAHDVEATRHRTGLLASQRALWEKIPFDDLSIVEGLLFLAEHSEGEASTSYYNQAYAAMRHQLSLRLFGSAAVILARIGASLVKSGYREQGQKHLREVAGYFLVEKQAEECRANEGEITDNEDWLIDTFASARPQLLEPLVDDYIAAGLGEDLAALVMHLWVATVDEFGLADISGREQQNVWPNVVSVGRILVRSIVCGKLAGRQRERAVEILGNIFKQSDYWEGIYASPYAVDVKSVLPEVIHEYVDGFELLNPGIGIGFQDYAVLMEAFVLISGEAGFDNKFAGMIANFITGRVEELSDSTFYLGLDGYKPQHPTGLGGYLKESARCSVHGLGFDYDAFDSDADRRAIMEGVPILFASLALLERPELAIREAIRKRVDGLEHAKASHHFTVRGNDDPYVPLRAALMPDFERLGMAGRFAFHARGDDGTLVYVNYNDLLSTVLVRLAYAYPDEAAPYLERAMALSVYNYDDEDISEELVYEPRVRFENYPEVVAKIAALERLRDAYVELLGDVDTAQDIHDALMDDYAHELSASAHKQIDAARAFLAESSGVKNTALQFDAASLEEDPVRYSPLVHELNFDAMKARHLARTGDTAAALSLANDVISRIAGTNGGTASSSYEASDVLRIAQMLSSGQTFHDASVKLFGIAVDRAAHSRGVRHKVYRSGMASRWGGGRMFEGYEPDIKVRSWHEDLVRYQRKAVENLGRLRSDDEARIESERFLLADQHVAVQDMTAEAHDRGLGAYTRDLIAAVESSTLTETERERIYLELVDRMLPRQVGDWAALVERAPQITAPFEDVIDDGRYPDLARDILSRLAHATRQVSYDPAKPTQNAGLSTALVDIARRIADAYPELLRVSNLDAMVGVSRDHDYLADLQTLFPQDVERAITVAATDTVDGLSYSVGDIITGTYDRRRATSELIETFGRHFISGADVASDESQTLLKIAREMLVRTNGRGKKLQKFLVGWVQQTAYEVLERPDADIAVRALFASRTVDEAQVLRPMAEAFVRRVVDGEDIPAEVIFTAMETLRVSGALSAYAFNLFATDGDSWAQDERDSFFAWVTYAVDASRSSSGTLGDIVTVLARPHQASEDAFLTRPMVKADAGSRDRGRGYESFAETHARFVSWKDRGGKLDATFSRPLDIVLYYALHLKDKLPFDEYIDLIIRRTSLSRGGRLKGTRQIAVWEEMLENFLHPTSEGVVDHRDAFHAGLERLRGMWRAADEEARLVAFDVPRAFRDLAPAVRFAVIRFFVDLPLGEREEVLSDFRDESLKEEEAFKLFFERTGNAKLAQFLSLMKGVVPERYRSMFADFRDQVAGSAEDEIDVELKRNYGLAPEDLFSGFESVMLKSGTIGEVYRGTIRKGTTVGGEGKKGVRAKKDLPVIVKIIARVRRDKIEQNLVRLKKVAVEMRRVAARFNLRFDPVDIVESFETTMRQEMDFMQEIENAREYSAILPEGIIVPTYHDRISRKNVLIMSELPGVAFDEVDDAETKRVHAEKLGAMLARHILVEGLFHDDLHPKNIFVDSSTLALLDFGRLGRLSNAARRRLVEFIMDMASMDPGRIAKKVRALTKRSERWASQAELEERIAKVLADAQLGDMVGVTDELFGAAAASGYAIAPEYIQAIKALISLEASVREDDRLSDFSMTPFIVSVMGDAVERLQEEDAK